MSVAVALDFIPPTYFAGPQIHGTDGDLVGELCRMCSVTVGDVEFPFAPDPEQQLILDYLFAYRPDYTPQLFDCTVIAPRQNLKTGLAKMAALGWLFITNETLVSWSAHKFSTTQEAFRDIIALIESNPDLDREVANVYRGSGDESIELKSGSRLVFKARTSEGGRGLSGDKIILDEAFALQPSHLGTLLPTLLARPGSQVLYASSAGLGSSEILRTRRDEGRTSTSPRSAYFEWCDDRPNEGCQAGDCDHRKDAVGCALDDQSRWTHMTALGRRITVEKVLDMRRDMPPEEFARELMGWWDDPDDDTDAATLAEWLAAEDRDAEPTGRLSFAVDAAPAHTYATIVVCGGGVLEVIERKRGTQWLPERLAELRDAHNVEHFVIDPAGPIGALIPELERAEVPLLLLNGRDSVNACTAIEVAIREGEAKHRGEPELLNAVGGAKRRKVGDGWKWTRADSTVDISPLVAATYAWWGAVGFDNDPAEPSIRFI